MAESKYLRFARTAYERPGRVGRSVHVDIFIPESGEFDEAITSAMCWTMAGEANDKYSTTAFFSSALGAFAPALLRAIVPGLSKKGAYIRQLECPGEATDVGYACEEFLPMYSFEETLVHIGISLILPFKHISVNNWTGFIDARKRALGNMLGLTEAEIAAYRYPLDLTRAQMVKSVLAGSMKVKQEILKWVMWASEDTGSMKTMARYVGSILAWNEMNWIVFINNEFVNSKSPILKNPRIQDEVAAFEKIMVHITRSPCPSSFRFFCTAEEEMMLQRQNFKILGAVAQELIRRKSDNKSIEYFAGTTAKGSQIVTNLADEHEHFCDHKEINKDASKTLQFIMNDGDYDELLRQEEGLN